MAEGLSGSHFGMPPSKRNFPFSRGLSITLFSLLLVLIVGLASQPGEARSQTPEPGASPPPNAKFIPGPSELWTAVDYTEDGWPIVAEDFGLTVVSAFGLPLEETVKIAEGLY
jgi:hypothetical protein